MLYTVSPLFGIVLVFPQLIKCLVDKMLHKSRYMQMFSVKNYTIQTATANLLYLSTYQDELVTH